MLSTTSSEGVEVRAPRVDDERVDEVMAAAPVLLGGIAGAVPQVVKVTEVLPLSTCMACLARTSFPCCRGSSPLTRLCPRPPSPG
jgi:hypothetical protein